ncbi:MAG: hypothetical protein AB7E52_09125 [Bdellovibrionales bacterium]
MDTHVWVNPKVATAAIQNKLRKKRLATGRHDPTRPDDALVLEGILTVGPCVYRLTEPPLAEKATLPDLQDAFERVLYGQWPFKPTHWGIGTLKENILIRKLSTLAMAVVGGFCLYSGVSMNELCEVMTDDVMRGWLGGDFKPTLDFPVRSHPSLPDLSKMTPTAHA